MRHNKPGYRGQGDQTESRGHGRNCYGQNSIQLTDLNKCEDNSMGKIIHNCSMKRVSRLERERTIKQEVSLTNT